MIVGSKNENGGREESVLGLGIVGFCFLHERMLSVRVLFPF